MFRGVILLRGVIFQGTYSWLLGKALLFAGKKTRVSADELFQRQRFAFISTYLQQPGRHHIKRNPLEPPFSPLEV
jgi:hypothetical protein